MGLLFPQRNEFQSHTSLMLSKSFQLSSNKVLSPKKENIKGLCPILVSHFSLDISLKLSMKNFHIKAKNNRFESHLTPLTFFIAFLETIDTVLSP